MLNGKWRNILAINATPIRYFRQVNFIREFFWKKIFGGVIGNYFQVRFKSHRIFLMICSASILKIVKKLTTYQKSNMCQIILTCFEFICIYQLEWITHYLNQSKSNCSKMAQTAQEYEKNFLANIESLTGHNLKHWLDLAKKSGLYKPMELTNFFKLTHKLNHAHSSLLAGIFRNEGKASFADSGSLIDKQLQGKENQRTLYEKTAKFICASVKGTEVVPKVTYISFTGTKEFAAINIKKEEIRLGMSLGNTPFTNDLEKAKISGPMAHITQMLVIKSEKQLNKELAAILKQAFSNRNK
jgi:predicted transport protein